MPKAIVVGASSGIGRAVAIRLAAHGYQVGLAGRRWELLEEVSQSLPQPSWVAALDLRESDAARKRFEQLVTEMDGVDLVVVSSGVGFLDEHERWESVATTLETNTLGFAAIADAAMRHFLAQGRGHLVGISSVAAVRPSSHAPAYYASKAFVSNYLAGLRYHVRKKQLPIHVTDIRPGLVDTAMAQGEGLFWVAPPEAAAEQIVAAIERRRDVAYVTRRWRLIAILLRSMPDWLYRRIA